MGSRAPVAELAAHEGHLDAGLAELRFGAGQDVPRQHDDGAQLAEGERTLLRLLIPTRMRLLASALALEAQGTKETVQGSCSIERFAADSRLPVRVALVHGRCAVR